MEPESDNGLDTFLRRVAQAATIGATVGAAVAAGRAAARRNGVQANEPESAEPENGDESQEERMEHEEQPQAQETEQPQAHETEPAEHEEEEPEELEPEPQPAEPRAEEAVDEAPEEQDDEESSDGQFDGEAASLIGRALRQVQQLTGREAEGVLGLRRDNGNWVVSIEVVELHRVPSSTDVLATYDVVVDENGELREYNRTGRYVRGRAGEQ